MFNKSEKEEREYLEKIREKLKSALERIDRAVDRLARELKEQKNYLWENKAGMDHVEKVSVRQSVTQSALTGEAALERKKRIRKLMQSPWFGRFDFRETGKKNSLPVYIGVYAYYDEEQKENIIYDWRAPVSTMFYDFELGRATYDAPGGLVEGDITLKRQFRIREGKMEYMLESSLNIHDEILQQELGMTSDDKMKHIVATIQRDQNAIIRNESSNVLIIQGVAGSGKTSIALHRIAFLLYRFRETIISKDILIISPNRVFADYISNVLPELGEEKIPETGMEELGSGLLENKYRFQSFFEHVSHIIDKEDDNTRERNRFKASFEIINKIDEYAIHIENEYFKPVDLVVRRYPVPAFYIEEKFRTYNRLPLFLRFNAIVKDAERDLLFYNSYEINAAERDELRKSVKNMFRITNLRELYKDFHAWTGRPELFRYAKGTVYEYSDLFPLIYLKIRVEGVATNFNIKHLLVDEMQDYTPVQYAVLAKVFPGRKTILGDANQSVIPHGSSSASDIARVFPDANTVKLTKSYRSTYEITRFAQGIIPDKEIEVIERHGENPVVIQCKSREDQINQIKETVADFLRSGYKSLGIICKTHKQAGRYFEALKEDFPDTCLLTAESVSFANGVIITSVLMAKGLEFDQVVIPDAESKHYHTAFDRGLFYVACTRAMHRLSVLYTHKRTDFIIKDMTGQKGSVPVPEQSLF
ncbi:MAG: AAA family ATPase [Bacteroidales bacterium]|nr:AAA family ATPase [Bacteroidales bacterium]MDT8402210.1 AAA family ATPase [Bacteroidales bacterium]